MSKVHHGELRFLSIFGRTNKKIGKEKDNEI